MEIFLYSRARLNSRFNICHVHSTQKSRMEFKLIQNFCSFFSRELITHRIVRGKNLCERKRDSIAVNKHKLQLTVSSTEFFFVFFSSVSSECIKLSVDRRTTAVLMLLFNHFARHSRLWWLWWVCFSVEYQLEKKCTSVIKHDNVFWCISPCFWAAIES